MKRYSIAPSSSRRRSTINPNFTEAGTSRAELEKLEQETTLVLQEIDKNLSKANSIINDRIFPILKEYSNSSDDVWSNVSFWKYFFEQSANVELSSYEARVDTTTDVNTIANTRNNFLLLDDEDEFNEERDIGVTAAESKREADQRDEFKKPILKSAVEESTPSWPEQRRHPEKHMHSSTPQLQKAPSILAGHGFPSSKFDSYDSIGMQPPPALTNALSSNEAITSESPRKLVESVLAVRTQTIRQSLDNFHRISISPKKSKTPGRKAASEGARRRSSMIQDLINSSPTLPEPPILQSEVGRSAPSGSEERESSIAPHSLKEHERLSPVLLPKDLSPPKLHQGNVGLQRFPTTPNFRKDKNYDDVENILRTPMGVRIRFGGDDSDIPPPQLQNNPLGFENVELSKSSEYDIQPQMATNISKEDRKDTNGDFYSGKRKKSKIQAINSEENIFLENSNQRNNSVTSTIYHSITNNNENLVIASNETSAQLHNSKENTGSHSQSRSISNLFEEVLTNMSSKNGEELQQNKEPQSKDIFGEISASQNDNTTENSTSELGSLLSERYKNLTSHK
ncbi:uncharacterized protein PRCAT00001263001 [Priceomyces carsonii]|uniref:uncharacterized protein n=1 Tax=Priceomyces carsonii TaxID=28549 RepID=UPI002ED99325|nr:unnamed protein product [Priceomyces carsonii]